MRSSSISRLAGAIVVVSEKGGSGVCVSRVVETKKGAPKYVQRRVDSQPKTW